MSDYFIISALYVSEYMCVYPDFIHTIVKLLWSAELRLVRGISIFDRQVKEKTRIFTSFQARFLAKINFSPSTDVISSHILMGM